MEQQEPTDNASTSFFGKFYMSGDASHSSSIEEYHSTNSELDAEDTNNSLTKSSKPSNGSILQRKYPLTRVCKERCPRWVSRLFYTTLYALPFRHSDHLICLINYC